jgi:aldehyde:ferredoxin oxidoreductase
VKTSEAQRRAHGHADAPCARCRVTRYIKGRNLCTSCWWVCERDDTLTDWPPRRTRLPGPELLTEYELLASAGNNHEQIADRMGYRAAWYLRRRVERARAEA